MLIENIGLTWNDDLGLSLLPTSALNTDMYITIPTSINKPERETDLITWNVISCATNSLVTISQSMDLSS